MRNGRRRRSNKIKLGSLGVFSLSLSCEGAESIEKFTEDNIKAVNINYNPGADFENLINQAEFKLVASRIAQAAILNAIVQAIIAALTALGVSSCANIL